MLQAEPRVAPWSKNVHSAGLSRVTCATSSGHLFRHRQAVFRCNPEHLEVQRLGVVVTHGVIQRRRFSTVSMMVVILPARSDEARSSSPPRAVAAGSERRTDMRSTVSGSRLSSPLGTPHQACRG